MNRQATAYACEALGRLTSETTQLAARTAGATTWPATAPSLRKMARPTATPLAWATASPPHVIQLHLSRIVPFMTRPRVSSLTSRGKRNSNTLDLAST
jgi:hypothetical protein